MAGVEPSEQHPYVLSEQCDFFSSATFESSVGKFSHVISEYSAGTTKDSERQTVSVFSYNLVAVPRTVSIFTVTNHRFGGYYIMNGITIGGNVMLWKCENDRRIRVFIISI